MVDECDCDPIIEKHRKEFERQVKLAQKERDKAILLLDAETIKTVQRLLHHRDKGKPNISLEASKHLSKLQGLEIERHEHSGKIEGLIVNLPAADGGGKP